MLKPPKRLTKWSDSQLSLASRSHARNRQETKETPWTGHQSIRGLKRARWTEMPEDVSPRSQTSWADSQVAWQLDRWYWYFTLANHKTHTQQGWLSVYRDDPSTRSNEFKKSQWCSFVTEPDLRLQYTWSMVRKQYISHSLNNVQCIVITPWVWDEPIFRPCTICETQFLLSKISVSWQMFDPEVTRTLAWFMYKKRSKMSPMSHWLMSFSRCTVFPKLIWLKEKKKSHFWQTWLNPSLKESSVVVKAVIHVN